jgi:hypothetical protein
LSRQEDVGAPPGFEDAIAWLMPMTNEQFPDVRSAAISDPQGAVLMVSKFVPPG